MSLVSTIIPAYNAARYIREAIDSALAQQGIEQEVIVVDDGSTDETWQILQTYGSRIRCLRQQNSGAAAARSRGLYLARGEWIAFLDADDVWEHEKLKTQLALATDAVGMVYTDRLNFGRIARVAETASAASTLWDGDIFEQLLLENFVTASSAIIRKHWLDRIGGFDGSLLCCEDWDLWLRFSAAGGLTRVVRKPLTHYRWHSASKTNSHIAMCMHRCSVLERALRSPRGARVNRRIARAARANVWSDSAWLLSEVNRWKAA